MIKNQSHSVKAGKRGVLLGAVLLAMLTQHGTNAAAQGVSAPVMVPPVVVAPVVTAPVVVAPVVGEPVAGTPVAGGAAVMPDTYVYYPSYGVYFNQRNRQYYYLNGSVWVNQPQPYGVTVPDLQASPYVNMNFHDAPAYHHTEMQRQYPRNWRPDPGHQDNRDVRDGPKDAGHDKQ